MSKKYEKPWNIEHLEACYRESVKSYCDGVDHAAKQNIPLFIEGYRISRVKDAIAPWITETIVSEEKVKGISESEKSDLGTRSADQGPRILDIGCGHGWYCFRLIDKWNFKGHITGVDVSEHNISVFNEEIKKRGFEDRISARSENAENLPFEDSSFDLVYSTEALEHMENPEKVFKEASRVLKQGGKFVLTTPSGPIHKFWKVYFWFPQMLKRMVIPEKTSDNQKIYDNPLSWQQIKKAAEGKGFELLNYHKSVLLPHESYIQFFPRFIQRILLFKARILEIFGPLTSWMGLHHIAMWEKK